MPLSFDWTPLPDEEARRLAADLLSKGSDRFLSSFPVAGRQTALSFYESVRLCHLQFEKDEMSTGFYLLRYGDSADVEKRIVLSGSSMPLHRLAREGQLLLTPETAGDYLRFFCLTVYGEAGPFLIVDPPGMSEDSEGRKDRDESRPPYMNLIEPLGLLEKDETGRFLFEATVYYVGALFRCDFAVSQRGEVEMLDDEPLVASSTLSAFTESLLEESLSKSPLRPLKHASTQEYSGTRLEHLSQVIWKERPVVAIESDLPFVEETVGEIIQHQREGGESVQVIRPFTIAGGSAQVGASVEKSPRNRLVLLSFRSRCSLFDIDRVAHDAVYRDVACLIGCYRTEDLPTSIQEIVDYRIKLPRLPRGEGIEYIRARVEQKSREEGRSRDMEAGKEPSPEDHFADDASEGPATGGRTDSNDQESDSSDSVLDIVRAQEPPYQDENVQFTLFQPKRIPPQKWCDLVASAHLEERRPEASSEDQDPIEKARRKAEQIFGHLDESEITEKTDDSRQPIPQGGEISFVPDVEGVQFNPPHHSFLWQEDEHTVQFRMRASNELDGQIARGRMSVFLGAVLVADLTLKFRVSSTVDLKASENERTAVTATPYRKIFASYSHKDTEIVEQFEHYAEAFGDEYLRDVRTLRSGEEWNPRLLQLIDDADVFQLFWSQNAMESPYVRQEWTHALRRSEQGFVRPVYWEDPFPERPPQLPPPTLRALHFQRLPGTGTSLEKDETASQKAQGQGARMNASVSSSTDDTNFPRLGGPSGRQWENNIFWEEWRHHEHQTSDWRRFESGSCEVRETGLKSLPKYSASSAPHTDKSLTASRSWWRTVTFVIATVGIIAGALYFFVW